MFNVNRDGPLAEVRARHAQEAKGLLVMIKYLKSRVAREVSFRDSLASQKDYLASLVSEKQAASVVRHCDRATHWNVRADMIPSRVVSTWSWDS